METAAPSVSMAPARRVHRNILVVLVPLFVGLAASEYAATGGFDLPRLIGDRTKAAFDLWSLQHCCAGVLLGAVLMRTPLRSADLRSFVLVCLFVALCWEAAELAMEAGWFGAAVSTWKDGFEHWSNRLVGDPLMVMSGALIGRRYSAAWKIVAAPAGIWLFLNLASPSSMSIQRLLF